MIDEESPAGSWKQAIMTDRPVPPDWVLIEAARRSDYKSASNVQFLRQKYPTLHPAFRALCEMIEDAGEPS